MEDAKLLSRITIPTPCPVAWDQMEGDDQTRFCRQCSKYVYNFVELESDDIVNIIRRNEGEVCAQLYRRRDGTIVTASCQSERKGNLLQFSLASLMVLMTGTATAFGLGRYVPRDWIMDQLRGQSAANQQIQGIPLGGVIEMLPEDYDDTMDVSPDESFEPSYDQADPPS